MALAYDRQRTEEGVLCPDRKAEEANVTLLAVMTASWANGGPVDSNDPTPAGGISPRAVDDIRLISEKLSITLEDDFETYSVQASYQLHNDGPARTVEFGVPVIWKLDGNTATTPERMAVPEFRAFLREASADVGVSLFVVDEAHCVSQWGHDFRPSYLVIRRALEELGRPPVLATTATAPK